LVSTEISETQVKKLLNSFRSSNSLTTFIIDSQDNLIADMDVNLDNVISKNKISESKNNVDYFTYIFNNIKYRGIYNKLSQYDMTIGMIFDERQMLKPINDVRIWLISVLVSSLLFSIIFISFTYRNIVYPINNLIETMKGIKKGDLKKRVPMDSKSDLGFLLEQFNSMVEQLDKLINEVYIARLKLKQSQIRFLQSQINPHFLYNSLFCLYNMIKNEDIENAANLTLYLGEYFKIASHSDKACVLLRQEMDNIQVYFNIHSFRNPAKTVLVVEIQDVLYDIIIPRLCIQTFVENSILHGIENSDRKCFIRINVFKEDEFIVIIVEDNGCGISQGKIKEIEDKFTTINYEEDHHGILNVYCRMKLMYGDNASMTVSNINPTGTSITIKLPFEMIKEGDGKYVQSSITR
jgi:two-component system, sensor histidine kinase YesM